MIVSTIDDRCGEVKEPNVNNKMMEDVMEEVFNWDSVLGCDDVDDGELHKVKFGPEEREVIFLMSLFRTAVVHLVKSDSSVFYAHCEGEGCPLCDMRNKARKRLFMPCYDPEIGAVGIAQATTKVYPRALAPQLRRLLSKAGEPVWVIISTRDQARFKVRAQPVLPDDDSGADVIKEFTDRVKSGDIDILSVCPRLTEDDLEDLNLTKKVKKR